MNISDFKAKCLKIVDQLKPSRLILLKHGKPVAKVIPIRDKNIASFDGCLAGQVKVSLEDLFSTQDVWDAES